MDNSSKRNARTAITEARVFEIFMIFIDIVAENIHVVASRALSRKSRRNSR
jgi:hypothetical protein